MNQAQSRTTRCRHRRRRSGWQEQISAKASFLQYERDRLCAADCGGGRVSAESVRAATDRHLRAARCAAGVLTEDDAPDSHAKKPTGLVYRWTGARIEAAFFNLHAAEVVLVDRYANEDIEARLPAVLARLQTCLPSADARLLHVEERFRSDAVGDSDGKVRPDRNGRFKGVHRVPASSDRRRPGGADEELDDRRAAFRDAVQVSYEAADEMYSRVRSFRNVLIVAAALLAVLVAAVCLVGTFAPQTIPLCFQPSFTAPGAPERPSTAEQVQSSPARRRPACPCRTEATSPSSC